MQMPDRALTLVKRQLWVRRLGLEVGAFVVAAVLVAASAVWVKEGRLAPPLASVTIDQAEVTPVSTHASRMDWDTAMPPEPLADQTPVAVEQAPIAALPPGPDGDVRWFNGRPVKPVRRMWMTVTAYSPDATSCGDSADGMTATLHDVTTNASRLVAADPRILRYGSLLSIPGYDDGLIVPVLDCGSRIRGHRLDVLFPTHDQARRWGVRKMQIVVWGYADGKPADDPRRLR